MVCETLILVSKDLASGWALKFIHHFIKEAGGNVPFKGTIPRRGSLKKAVDLDNPFQTKVNYRRYQNICLSVIKISAVEPETNLNVTPTSTAPAPTLMFVDWITQNFLVYYLMYMYTNSQQYLSNNIYVARFKHFVFAF
jgi:hypothetical protein